MSHPKLNKRTIGEVRRLIANGADWEPIAVSYGMTYETFRRACDPGYRKALNERSRKYREANYKSPTKGVLEPHVLEPRPPASVFVERDARASVRLSLTAKVCGDPPPGYSALDGMSGMSRQ